MRSRLPFLIACVLLALLAGLGLGAVRIAPADVWHGLVSSTAPDAAIVRELRLPRVLLGFLVGGSLALSGAVLQATIRNPLAEPYLLGISGGAGLAAVIVIALGVTGQWVLPLAAFGGALTAIAIVYRLSLVRGGRLDSAVLLLAGVVVSAFCSAMVGAILTLSDATHLRNAMLWMLGGLGSASWDSLPLFALYAIIPVAVLFWQARWLDLLALGDEPARSLGADPDRLRRIVYLTTSLLTAASVATCGMIGFVGLVVPHAVRRLWGPLHRPLLPSAFVLGGSFLVVADALARSVVPPIELPVGVITALVGVPLFAVLLRRTVT
ncbi:MAG TPA: iron ABC transporter permease [Gemmatimonadales bacterium]|nr:iron ABC transporter permease [Gemmatimonadales bacterium]